MFHRSTVYMMFRSPRHRNTVSNEGVEVEGGDRGGGEDEEKKRRRRERRGKEEKQKREEEKNHLDIYNLNNDFIL